jgi:DHA1 family bicyclomycin/chloramphenicol resistance-like MFS transporter
MTSSFRRNAIVLGLLAAVGPFAIDMYLPAFPAIAQDLGTDVGRVQLSLTSYFAAVAMFQMIYGPVSDRVGRKKPIYFGLGLYVAGAVGCALAGGIGGLIGFRFVQGIGGCAAIVCTRAIVRDLHTGAEAARLMATIMLVFSISPMLAPLAGSALSDGGAWRAIFWLIAAIGLLAIGLTAFFLPETRPSEKRHSGPASRVVGDYLRLLRDGKFLGFVFIGALSQATFFAYLGGSAAVFQGRYGLSPTQYGVMFAINAAAFIGGAQINSRLIRRFGAGRLVMGMVTILLALTGSLLLILLAGAQSIWAVVPFLFVAFFCLGSILPTTAVMALDPHGPVAGTASALMGTLQLASGAIAIAVVGLIFDGTAIPMVAAMALGAAGSFLLSLITIGPGLGRRVRLRHPPPSPEETFAEMASGVSEV